jgi:hypothetical protein
LHKLPPYDPKAPSAAATNDVGGSVKDLGQGWTVGSFGIPEGNTAGMLHGAKLMLVKVWELFLHRLSP